MLKADNSSQHKASETLQEDHAGFSSTAWLVAFIFCSLLLAGVFVWVDVPVTRSVSGIMGSSADQLSRGFASTVLLTIEATIALALIIGRMVRGHLSRFSEATALACLTSICAYAVNDSILKLAFGVATPKAVLHGARHTLDLLGGTQNSSFPSGHMALAGAFAGVFMRLYPRSRPGLSALLLAAALLLVIGEWHFVSDVMAGSFVGLSAGLLAGELWRAHAAALALRRS